MLLPVCIGLLACFHAISPERSCLWKIAFYFSRSLSEAACIAHSHPIACSARLAMDRQTDTHTQTILTLAAHACQGLIIRQDRLLRYS